MVKKRSLTWDTIVPFAIIACGVIATICNAFPYVHVSVGREYQSDQASAGITNVSMWQSIFVYGHLSLGFDYILLGALPIFIGIFKALSKKLKVLTLILNTGLCLTAFIGIFFIWLTSFTFLNDGADIVTLRAPAFIAICAYGGILCSLFLSYFVPRIVYEWTTP